jgi:hypothetical protein
MKSTPGMDEYFIKELLFRQNILAQLAEELLVSSNICGNP